MGTTTPATKSCTFRGETADPGRSESRDAGTVRVVDADHRVMERYEPRSGKEVVTLRIECMRSR